MTTTIVDLLQGSLKTRVLPDTVTSYGLTEPSVYDVSTTSASGIGIVGEASVAQNQEFVLGGPGQQTEANIGAWGSRLRRVK